MEKSGQKRKGFMRRLYRAARSAGKAVSKRRNSPSPVDFATETVGAPIGVTSEMRSASLPNKSAPGAVQKQASSAQGGNGEMRGGYGGDENVDVKAATYILWVRERLKKERSMDQKVYSENSEIRVQKI